MSYSFARDTVSILSIDFRYFLNGRISIKTIILEQFYHVKYCKNQLPYHYIEKKKKKSQGKWIIYSRYKKAAHSMNNFHQKNIIQSKIQPSNLTDTKD